MWLLKKRELSKKLINRVFSVVFFEPWHDWGFGFAGVFLSDVFADQAPQVVNVDGWAEVLVLLQVKVSHTDLTEVTWMVLVKIDSVMMLTTGETSSTWMLSVLTNSSVTVGDLASHLSCLPQMGRHVRLMSF